MGTKSNEERDGQTYSIIARLISLPDSDLKKILPEFEPDTIRRSLRSLQNKFCLPIPPRPASLFHDTDTDSPAAPTGSSGTIHLYTDGASRGNPGEGGAGVVIIDDQEREIFGRGYYLGQCTNNEAEYRALILGLKEAAERSRERLIVFLDSQLIVRQINGEYKVKSVSLKPLFNQVRDLLSSFRTYSVKHIPRSENSRADSLANQGIDEAEEL